MLNWNHLRLGSLVLSMENGGPRCGQRYPNSPRTRTGAPTRVGLLRDHSWMQIYPPPCHSSDVFCASIPSMVSLTQSHTMVPLSALHPPDAPPLSVITSIQGDGVVREVSMRLCHLLEICKNRGFFASDDLWRRRTRACVEATASLIFCANAELDWFGDIGKLLRDIGKVEKTFYCGHSIHANSQFADAASCERSYFEP
ncbi:hypothetical protein BJV74DRAFT_828111 [Russula compacta]|nr:hypothetical protein BJV74DRAFT_828111 [Russula compacta]